MFSVLVLCLPEEQEVSLVVEGGHLPVVAHWLGVEEGLQAAFDAAAEAGAKVVQHNLGKALLERLAVAEDLPRQPQRRQLEGQRRPVRQVDQRQRIHLR